MKPKIWILSDIKTKEDKLIVWMNEDDFNFDKLDVGPNGPCMQRRDSSSP
jgi:hypothetical protein